MGIKDKRHKENPNECVECETEAVLNKYGVCKECWKDSMGAQEEEWEDTLIGGR